MSYDIGPRIGIDGEAEFRKSILNINASLKAMGAEMQAVTSAYEKGDKSAENLTRQNDLLSSKLLKHKKKIAELSAMLEKSREKYGDNCVATQQWQRAVHEATAAMNKETRTLAENERAMQEAEEANSELARAQREAEAAAERLRQEEAKLASEIEKTSGKLQGASEAMGGINRAALIAGAALAGMTLIAGKVGMDFEAQMSKVAAISGASAQELEALNAVAKEMGETTKFSATESGQALEFMAMAGWKSQQMIDGLPGIMNLAAASGEELGIVSDIVTDALTGFGLKASDAARFADVLATASAASNTNVAMMGETFKYAAPVAGALGYSIEDVSVAIGLMANSGIKGEMAGTALRGMLTNLAKPTKQSAEYLDALKISLTDAGGEVKPLSSLLVDLRGKFAGLTDAQKAEYAAGIAGKEAMSGMLALVNSSDADFEKLTLEIANASGSAQEMADVMNNNLKGQLTLLGSAAEGVGIAFYEKFGQQAAGAVEKLSAKVGQFSRDLSSGKLDTQLRLIGTAAAAGTAAIIGMNAALAVKDLRNFAAAAKLGGDAMRTYQTSTLAAAAAQKALNLAQAISPLGWIAIAAGTAATAFVAYKAMANDATTPTSQLNARIRELNEGLDEQKERQKELADARAESFAAIESESDRISGYVAELEELTDENGRVEASHKSRAEQLAILINKYIPEAVKKSEDEAGAYYKIKDSVNATIDAKKREMMLSALEEEYQNALKQRAESQKKITDATRAHGAAVKEVQRIEKLILEGGPKSDERYLGALTDAKRNAEDTKVALDDAKTSAQGFNDTIAGFETAMATENMAEFETAIAGMSGAITKNTNDNQVALEQAVVQQKVHLDRIVADYAASRGTKSEAQRRADEEEIRRQKETLDRQVEEARLGGIEIPEGFGSGVTENSSVYSDSMKAMLNTGKKELEAAGTSMKDVGAGYDALIAAGILVGSGEVTDASGAVVRGAQTEAEKAIALMEKIGEFMALGIAKGLKNKTAVVEAGGRMLANAVDKAMRKESEVQSPSRKTMAIGAFMGEGLAIGLKNSEGKVVETAEELSKSVLKAATDWVEEKKFYNDLAASEEREFWEGVLQNTGLQAAELAKVNRNIYKAKADESKAAFDHSKKWIDEEKFYKRLSAEEEVAAWERVVSRKNLSTDQQLEAERNLYSAQQRMIDEQTKRDEAYEKSLTSRAESLRSFAGLFDEAAIDTETSGKKLLDNLQSQVDMFAGWQKDMQQLAENGASEALLAELREMGPKAASEIRALTQLTEKDLAAYSENFKLLGTMARDQAQQELKSGPLELPLSIVTLSKEQSEASVAESVGGVTEAIVANTERLTKSTGEATEAMCAAVATRKPMFYGVGTAAMQGLENGIRTQGRYAVSAAREIADAIIWEMQRALDIHSPSRKMRDLVGKPAAQGVLVGFEVEMNKFGALARQTVGAGASDFNLAFGQQMSTAAQKMRALMPGQQGQQDQLQRIGEGIVNGVAQAAQSSAGGLQIVELHVNLDGRQIAKASYDPLRDISRQRG